MEFAYLGLFEKIFNWVLAKIFDPIFKWLSSLLNTVFTWIFQKILSPILLPILKEAIDFFFDLWMQVYGNILYSMFSGLLKLIDYMETAFDVFIGIRTVKYYPDPSVTEVFEEGSLIEVLLQQKTVSTIFWMITISGLAIALLLTIFGTAKSAFDLDFETKRPVSKVLTAMMKAMIQFFSIPFFVYFMLKLSTAILGIVTTAVTGNLDTTLGRIVFLVASLKAAAGKDGQYADYNVDKTSYVVGCEGDPRNAFYSLTGGKDYANLEQVREYFDVTKFDYLIGVLASVFLLFVMAVCLITFVQRIFEILLLYMVSPYFVSTMPLDDGERFGRWRDMFIGKCFTGFGSAIGMRLYLLVCRMIMGNTIKFSQDSIASIEMDYLMKLFFLIGGAWAVFKSGPMITSLISAGAGQQESMTQSVVGASLYGHTIGKAMNVGKGALMSAFRGGSGESALARKKNAMNGDPSQKFDGARSDRMTKAGAWKKASVTPGTQRSKITIGANRKPSAAASGSWRRASVSPGVNRGNLTIGANRTPQAGQAGGWRRASVSPGVRRGNLTIGANRNAPDAARITVRPRRFAMSNDPEMKKAAQLASSRVSGMEAAAARTDMDTAYKEKKNFQLGSVFRSTYDADGNHKIRVLGFGVNRNADGKTMAFKMPIMDMKLQRTDPDQSLKLARIDIPGITKINSNVKNGSLNYSDVSVLGGLYQYNKDSSGTHKTIAGVQRHHFADGSSGVDVGNIQIRANDQGSSVSVGSHISMKTSGEHVTSVQVGTLEYSRSGIRKQPKPSGSDSSAAGGSSVSGGSSTNGIRVNTASTTRTRSGGK